MEVYKIKFDSNNYQSLIPKDIRIWETNSLVLDCDKKHNTWETLDVYVHNPKLISGDFSRVCSGGFVVTQRALSILRSCIEMAGEILTLNNDGQPLYLINILECVNCLDAENSRWILGKNGKRLSFPTCYKFFKDRFSESTLFKIPETSRAEVLTITGIKDHEYEFKEIVETAELKGLTFEKIWSDNTSN